MSVFKDFIGPANKTTSRSVSVEDTVNLYLEQINDGTPKATRSLKRRPGLKSFADLGSGPVWTMFFQNTRLFAIGGQTFAEVLPNGTVIVRGMLAPNGRGVLAPTISSNGTAGFQVLITSGGLGYIFNLQTNAFAQITDPSFPAHVVQGVFINGYFIVLTLDGTFYLSTLEDGTTWSNADFAQESQFSDTVVAMLVTQDRLCLFGTQNTALWYNSGASDFPFTPIPSAIPEHGILAPCSAIEINNTPYWLGQDQHGAHVVWYLNGLVPTVASSIAVADNLSRIPVETLQQACAWGYQSVGHLFYVLQVPIAGQPTWVYDLTVQAWHRQGIWTPQTSQYQPHIGRCHVWAFGRHLVGDRQSGHLYQMDADSGVDLVALAS